MKPLPMFATFGVLVFSGLVHGLWTDRWGNPEVLEQALARVREVPLTLGAWQGKELDADAETFRRAGAQAYWIRQYTQRETNRSISVILMCGRAGRMSVHTPEVCYPGVGFDMVNAPATFETKYDGHTATLWSAKFTKGATAAADLRLSWGWNAGDGWHAPTSPRWQFRGRPFLYKLYVIQERAPGSPSPTANPDDALPDFLQHLLPALEKTLFP